MAPKHDSYGISRNVGVQNSTGDVILFMDADDYCSEIWAANVLKNFESNPMIGIVSVSRKPSNLKGWFMNILGFEYKSSGGSDAGSQPTSIDWREVTTKGTGWLKKAILEAGGFDGAMFFGTEDKDLAFRITKLGYKVVQEPNATITAAPVGGALNFLKDKYWRAGVGHGYFRHKHGIYRPSLSGIVSLLLVCLAVGLLHWQIWLALPFFILAGFTFVSLAKEGLYLRSLGAPLKSTIAFLFVKWLSRIAEFAGFVRGYLIFKGGPE